jgi:hypothetical protein
VNDGIEPEADISRASRYQVRASGATLLTWVGSWVLALALVYPLAGSAREPQLEPSVRSDPGAAPQVEMDQPAEEPDVVPVKRGVFKRLGPQSLTQGSGKKRIVSEN